MSPDQTILRIPTADPDVYAFRIRAEVTADDMQGMADTMNAAFDTKSKVSMLLIFDHFEGQETGAAFDLSSIRSSFRALAHVDKYAVVGAPSAASTMIRVMDKIIPVDARTFEAAEVDQAWAFVGTKPAASPLT